MSIKPFSDDLKSRLLWLMTFRVGIVTLLLGVATFIHLGEGGRFLAHSIIPIYILIGTSYLITFASLLSLRLLKESGWFADLQIAIDILLATALVYVTGGIDSVFSFLYIFTIIWAGIVLQGRRVFLAASLSSILYGALLELQYFKFLPQLENPLSQPQAYSDIQVLYKVFINITAFYAVSSLSHYLFTQIKMTGDRLKEKEIDYEELDALNRKIVEEINSGLVTIDQHGLIASFNKAAEDITGYTLRETYREKIDGIFPGLMARISRYKSAPAFNKRGGRWEMPYVGKGGNRIYLAFSISPRRGRQGEDIGSIVIFQDLTAYREMEEAVRRAEKLSAVGQLAAGIAHEIRNPLASMSGSIQMLRDELVLDQENRRLMDIILRETERLNKLITGFLDYARPYRPEKEEVDLSNVLMETLDVFEKGLSQEQRITIQRHITPQLKIHGERERLRDVLWNLLNNAVQSMSGEGTVKVSLKKDRDEVVVEIADTGDGIKEKDLKRVFEPFFTTKSYGSGLGLATVYRIIDGHGGEIIVESEKGKGTVFSVRLPISTSINESQE